MALMAFSEHERPDSNGEAVRAAETRASDKSWALSDAKRRVSDTGFVNSASAPRKNCSPDGVGGVPGFGRPARGMRRHRERTLPSRSGTALQLLGKAEKRPAQLMSPYPAQTPSLGRFEAPRAGKDPPSAQLPLPCSMPRHL
jgi:hypothetical protein